MNREDGRRKQAQDLLRAMTDIDDRFLMEAMGDMKDLDLSAEYDPEKVRVKLPGTENVTSEMAADRLDDATGGRALDVTGSRSGDATESRSGEGAGESTSQEPDKDKITTFPQDSGNKRRPGRMRRYSAWALTAAACLTVIVVGRHVRVNSVKTSTDIPVVESEFRGDSSDDSALQADGSAKEAAENAAQSAGEAADNYAQDLDGEREVGSVQSAGEAAENAAQSAGEAAENAAQDEPAMGALSDDSGMTAGNGIAVPNPFINFATVEEAEKAAGFEISLPQAVKAYDSILYRAMRGEMIEVVYLDENKDEGYRIRKAVNAEDDISGDSTEYAAEKMLKTGDGTEVHVRGNQDDEWSTASWKASGEDGKEYSYAVLAGRKTFTSDEILGIVEEMTGTS